jgi:hypothetical protein
MRRDFVHVLTSIPDQIPELRVAVAIHAKDVLEISAVNTAKHEVAAFVVNPTTYQDALQRAMESLRTKGQRHEVVLPAGYGIIDLSGTYNGSVTLLRGPRSLALGEEDMDPDPGQVMGDSYDWTIADRPFPVEGTVPVGSAQMERVLETGEGGEENAAYLEEMLDREVAAIWDLDCVGYEDVGAQVVDSRWYHGRGAPIEGRIAQLQLR